MNIADIGFTREEVMQKVVDQLCHDLMHDGGVDDEGREYYHESEFAKELQAKYREAVDAKVNEIGDRVVVPAVADAIEKATMQATNEWGEKKGKAFTFTEYLVAQAERYMTEPVNYDGKSQAEYCAGGRYSSDFKKAQTRIVHLVHEYLHYEIEKAMKQALNDFNATVAKGIEEAIKIQVQALLASMKVDIKTKA